MSELAELYRPTDGDGSRMAAQRHHASGRRQSNISEVVSLVKLFPGSTSNELALHTTLERHEIARRLPDAQNAGLVHGVKPDRGEIRWYPGQRATGQGRMF